MQTPAAWENMSESDPRAFVNSADTCMQPWSFTKFNVRG